MVSSTLSGIVNLKRNLSGMPHCRLLLQQVDNDTTTARHRTDTILPPLPNPIFHRCVDQVRYTSDRKLYFVPPDGSFELLRFQATPASSILLFHSPNHHLPIVAVDVGVLSSTPSTIVYSFSAAVHNACTLKANSVVIRIPLLASVTGESVEQPLLQRVFSHVVVEQHHVVWKLWWLREFQVRAVGGEWCSGRLFCVLLCT